MQQITEKTSLPLSIVLGVCTLLITIAVWGAKLEARVSTHETEDDTRVARMQEKQEKIQETYYSIDKRLSRIEEKLGVK